MARKLTFGNQAWKNMIGNQLFQERERRGLTLRAVCRGIGWNKNRSPEIGCLERNTVWNWRLLMALLQYYELTLEIVPR